MAQLGDEDIDSMENYLMQMENAHASGDAANLAQLGANIDENLMAVADYLVQLDDQEIDKLNHIVEGEHAHTLA